MNLTPERIEEALKGTKYEGANTQSVLSVAHQHGVEFHVTDWNIDLDKQKATHEAFKNSKLNAAKAILLERLCGELVRACKGAWELANHYRHFAENDMGKGEGDAQLEGMMSDIMKTLTLPDTLQHAKELGVE